MGILNWFRGRTKEEPQEAAQENDTEELEPYPGIRVEVTTSQGQLLFVAKLLGLHGNRGELHQYSEAAIPPDSEPVPVRIRGYSDRDRKAVYMEGVIRPSPRNIWLVEELKVCSAGNERAFFRLTTNLDATATMFSGLEMGEKPCKLLNISVGGASVAWKVRLLEDRPVSAIYGQVVRVTEKKDGEYEYGCRFLELTEEEEEKITRSIFTVQRQQRNGR